MGGKELYDNFMKKLKNEHHHRSFRDKKAHLRKTVKIEIQLSADNRKNKVLDQSMLKVIQNEYAVKLLTQIGLQATQLNIDYALDKAPLSSCEFQAVWNNAGWIADTLIIYPSKPNKKTFDTLRTDMANK